jgi:hypothetical protein
MVLRKYLYCLAFVLCITILTPAAWGQEFRGKIQGLVTDASKAVVPGATITLLNIKTGVQTVKVTNETGLYRFDNVDPGSYSITAELSGFSKYIQENVTVQAQGDVTVNISLKVGGVNETVTVTESPVAVSFNTTNIALTIDTKLAEELPRYDRNPFKLTYLNPAVQDTRRQETNPFLSWSANSIEMGGGTDKKNDLQVDGSPIGAGYKASYIPNTDSIQEVNVQQNSVDAEMGHSAGGSVSMTLKAGTNEWHGTTSWNHRNPKWNAIMDRTTRNNVANRNNIGAATLGNPIIKNKLFNFFSFERWWMGTPGTVLTTVPTELEKKGDFSQSLNSQGKLRVIYDPYTTVVSGGVVTRTPFTDNKIPANRINPMTQAIMNTIWAPNRTPDSPMGTNNFTTATMTDWNYWNLSDRVDWFINDKLRVNGRYSIFRTTSLVSNDLLMANEYYINNATVRNASSYSGDGIWTMDNTTVANFHYTWHKMLDNADSPKKLELGGLKKYWPNSNWYAPFDTADRALTWFPSIGIAGLGRGGYYMQEPGGWSWSAKLSKQYGSHFLKTGFEYRHSDGDGVVGAANLSFSFPAALTANTYLSPNTQLVGHEFATFLLGALDDTSTAKAAPTRRMKTEMYGTYIQDDWKVNRRITLNLGLRYELDTPWHDPDNKGSIGLDLTQPIPEMVAAPPVFPTSVTALRAAAPIYNGYWKFSTNDHPGIWETQKLVLMPRVGMALRVDDKTALRVGWARFVAPSEYNYINSAALPYSGNNYSGSGNMSFLEPPYMGYDSQQAPLALVQGIPQASFTDPFPTASNPLQTPKGSAYGRYFGLGVPNIVYANPNFKRGVNDRINVTLSRQIWNRMVAEVTYFANIGHDLSLSAFDTNAADPRIGYANPTQMDVSVANPFYNYLTPTIYPGPNRNTAKVAQKTLLRPYPQYGGVYEAFQSNQSNRYQALQLKIQRPFLNGYNFLVGYNYRRERTTGYYDEVDAFLNKLTWMDSSSPHHSASIAGSYEVPVGKGRQFFATMPKALDYVLGGWQFIGAWYFNSGNYLVFGPMVATGDPHLDNPKPEKWFDTSKFSRLPAYTQRTNPLMYPDVRGPIYWDIQASVGKTFKVGDKAQVQAKLVAYNLTNRLNRADPDMTVTSSTFGTALRQGNGGQNNVMSGRQLEAGLKILF